MIANIVCAVHGFSHVSAHGSKFSTSYTSYTHNLMKFTIEGQIRYGRPKSNINVNGVYQYAFEMSEPCPDGFNKSNNSTFTCDDRRGIVVKDISICTSSKHESLTVLADDFVDETSICCILPSNKIARWPIMKIGDKCILQRAPFKKYAGVCKWMGKINDIECIGAEMTNWISNECNGYCMDLKIFDCRDGHGVFIRASDIELEELELHQNGFVDLKNIYQANCVDTKSKKMLKIGRRAEFGFIKNKKHETHCNKGIFGVIKWIGTINKGVCVGLELDSPCEGAMDGVINCAESFECDPGYGAVCPIKSVAFDYYIYNVEFTVGERFNIESTIIYKEDLDETILQKKGIGIDTKVYIRIEKRDRTLSADGILKWFGYIQGFQVGILEMVGLYDSFIDERGSKNISALHNL